jgi:flagellar export protein FliJ
MNKAVCDIMIKKKDLEMTKLSSSLAELQRRTSALSSKISSLDGYIAEYSTDLQNTGQAHIDLTRHRAISEFLGQLFAAKDKLTEAVQGCNGECSRIQEKIRRLHIEQSKYQKMADARVRETLAETDKFERKNNEELFLGSFVRAQQALK